MVGISIVFMGFINQLITSGAPHGRQRSLFGGSPNFVVTGVSSPTV
jgi:hypothetical protein